MNLQLTRLRKEAGYKSRSSFAEAIGVAERRIKSWETQETKLRLDDACMIADFLKCTLDELAGRDTPLAWVDSGQKEMNIAYIELDRPGREAAKAAVVALANASAKSEEHGDAFGISNREAS